MLLLAGLAIWSLAPLGGERIVLETGGYDPPDPFRGDYVSLAYPAADVRFDQPGVQHNLRSHLSHGETVYLLVEPGPRSDPGGAAYWTVVAATNYRPETAKGQVCLKGEVDRIGNDGFHLLFGLESYFVQKDEDFRDWNGKEVSVVAAVRGCTARIVELRLDGEPWAG